MSREKFLHNFQHSGASKLLERDRRALRAPFADASGAARAVYRCNSRENVYGTLDAVNSTIPHAI